MDRLIIAGLVAVVALFAADRFWLGQGEQGKPGSEYSSGTEPVATSAASRLLNHLCSHHLRPHRHHPNRKDNAFIATTFDWDHRTPTGWQMFVNKVMRKLRLPVRLTPAPSDMANVEARMNLFHLLEQTVANKVPGDVVDVGCNAGDSTIVKQRVITTLAPEKQVHAYDSFEGLPELTENDAKDDVYGKGYMGAGLDLFTRKFKALNLKMPHTHKGWFEATIPSELPERISFALIDGDLYESTKHVLPHLYARMAPGTIGMIAVYYDEKIFPRKGVSGGYMSPGVKRATDEFFKDKPEKISLLYANEYSNGYFRKL